MKVLHLTGAHLGQLSGAATGRGEKYSRFTFYDVQVLRLGRIDVTHASEL